MVWFGYLGKKESFKYSQKGIKATYKIYLILTTDQRACHIKHTPIYIFIWVVG